MRPAGQQVMEDALADMAYLLAEITAPDLVEGKQAGNRLSSAIESLQQHRL